MNRTTFFAAVALSAFVCGIGGAGAVQVTVPGTATGGFGLPNNGYTPMVAAFAVGGPGTITISYVSGTVNYGGASGAGPNGGHLGPSLNSLSFSYPLDEAVGINSAAYPNKDIYRVGALIGAFVPHSTVAQAGFSPVDGTKGIAPIGIEPSQLFFVGNMHVIDVNGPGTLYLGINDNGASDNSGSFVVNVWTP